jgi:EAL domain-containing protein (putative c-di-GMP-specific phosphodiesterase class I)
MQVDSKEPASAEPGTAEAQLLAYLRRLEGNYNDWRAIHLHLSKLKACHRRPYQLRVAASEFDGLLRRVPSELFQLRNGDILYLWQGGTCANVDQVVMRLRYLFSDDPLTVDGDAAAEEPYDTLDGPIEPSMPAKLCSWFELEHEFRNFAIHVEDLLEQIAKSGSDAGEAPSQALDPALLTRLEHSLATMDLSGLTRRQAICAMLPPGGPKPVFDELFIAVRELAETLVPGVDLTSDTWLFQRLAGSLDCRLLTSLARDGIGASKDPISINLRLATLLSPEFLEFDHHYRRAHSSPVIIELQLIDIFAELGAYLFIREFVRERGYLICIDGLHYLHLPLIDRKQLGADLVKVLWSPDLTDSVSEARQEELKAAIMRAGIERVVLCRCDSLEAIRWGQSMGIRLFQGYYVDSRLRASRPRAIAAARSAMRDQADQSASHHTASAPGPGT